MSCVLLLLYSTELSRRDLNVCRRLARGEAVQREGCQAGWSSPASKGSFRVKHYTVKGQKSHRG